MKENEERRICTQLRIPYLLWQTVRHAAVDANVSANEMANLLITVRSSSKSTPAE